MGILKPGGELLKILFSILSCQRILSSVLFTSCFAGLGESSGGEAFCWEVGIRVGSEVRLVRGVGGLGGREVGEDSGTGTSGGGVQPSIAMIAPTPIISKKRLLETLSTLGICVSCFCKNIATILFVCQ